MASKGKWSLFDFVVISGLVLLAAISINWFGNLGFEPLDKYGAMMFETKGSKYTEGYEGLGIDYDHASSACRAAMQGAGDAKMRIRGAISKAEAADDRARVAELEARLMEIDNGVRSACAQ